MVVSRKGLAELIRQNQQLEEDNRHLRKDAETLRAQLEKVREKNARLSDKVDHVQEKLAKLQSSLPVLGADAKTAAAVGMPTSKTFFKQPPPPPGERKAPGGQPGHKATTRPRPVPNGPSRELTLQNCPQCSTPLGQPCDAWSKILTDLPAATLEIFALIIHRYRCPGCGERVHAPIPEAYQGEFGPRVKVFVAELRALGMPLEKITELLEMSFGLEVSAASVLAMEERVAERLDGTYQGLWEELRDGARTPHAEGDETSLSVNGKNWWVWVGTIATTTVYFTQNCRSGAGADTMWTGYTGSLTHDGLDSYNSVTGAVHQFDLVHGNRWLQKVEAQRGIETRGFLKEVPPKFLRQGRPPKEFLKFAKGIRQRFADEVKWVEGHPKAPLKKRVLRYGRAVRSMDRFLARPWKDRDVVRLAGEYRQRLHTLYTFVRVPGTPWNSNEAEREVKSAVLIRKVSGGRRTKEGTEVMDRILTVWRTCRKRGVRFWDVVTERLEWTGSVPGPPLPRPTG